MVVFSLANAPVGFEQIPLSLDSPAPNAGRSESFLSLSFSDWNRPFHSSSRRGYLAQLDFSLIMPFFRPPLGSRIRTWLRDYDRIQSLAVLFIYVQIGCSLVGSLGALFNGVLLVNLVISLFALVAIESSSQSLGRTYAVLLFFAILLDVAWLILFSHTTWNYGSEYGASFVVSVRLALSMQIVSFAVRFLSSFLWIQMYRLGVSTVSYSAHRQADFDVRNSFINPPSNEIASQNLDSSEILGGSIYDPVYYSSLFEDNQEMPLQEGDKENIGRGSTSASGSPQLKSCISRSFQATEQR